MSGELTWSELKSGSAFQARIIGALMLREMRTRFGEYHFGYVWALIEPLVQIGILSGMFYVLGARPPLGMSYEAFFFTGYVTFAIFRDLSTRGSTSVSANRALLALPPVRNMDAIWARLGLEVMTSVASVSFLIAIFLYLEVPIVPADPLRVGQGFAAMLVLGAGFGILNAVLVAMIKPWSMILSWMMRLQYIFSGVFFLPEKLPPVALDILVWNPASHGIALVREGFYSGYKCNILMSPYPFVVGGALAVLGLTLEKLFRRRVDAK